MKGGSKGFKKGIKIAGIVLLVLILGGSGLVYYLLNSSLPDVEGSLVVEGLEDSIAISRDEQSRPRIYASEKEDLFFGQGFAQAQDRLWQMELHRRAGQGRVSELVGEGELDFDILLRRTGLSTLAETLREKSQPATIDYMSAYASGINAYLEQLDVLPPEFMMLQFEPEPWSTEDVFHVIAVIVFMTSDNYEEQLLRISLEEELDNELFEDMIPPAYPAIDVPPAWSEDSSFAGNKPDYTLTEMSSRDFTNLLNKKTLHQSNYYPRLSFSCNSWAISPELSETEEALFAFDSHSAIEVPNQFYENHLILEDNMELYGWSVPGMPGLLYGFNDYLAWGMTNTGDTQDLFLEKRHPEEPHLFKYDDEWYEAETSITEIEVAGKETPKELEIIETRHGPLISEDPPISLRWSAHDTEEGFDAMFDMNFAQDWEEFRDALNRFTMPSTQITYADVEGNIASRTVGLIPIRRQGTGALASPGWDPEYGWEGYIPMDDLPELVNPPDGYLATANAVTTLDDYPYIISVDNATGYRMKRIVDMLEKGESFDLEKFKEMQTDWYNAHAEKHLPTILAVLDAHREELDSTEIAAKEVLREWKANPYNIPEAAGPVIFESWYLQLIETIFKDEMSDELYKEFLDYPYLAYENVERFLEQGESSWFDNEEELILKAFRTSVAQMSDKLGNEPTTWRWDEIQSISFDHIIGQEVELLRPIFGRGPHPFGGSQVTVNRAGYRLHRPYEVSNISALRLVANMGSEVTAYGSMPMGQSGHLLSPHFDDQLEKWLAGDYYTIKFNEELSDERTLILE